MKLAIDIRHMECFDWEAATCLEDESASSRIHFISSFCNSCFFIGPEGFLRSLVPHAELTSDFGRPPRTLSEGELLDFFGGASGPSEKLCQRFAVPAIQEACGNQRMDGWMDGWMDG